MKKLKMLAISCMLQIAVVAQAETEIRVQDDLFKAANQQWLQSTEIPASSKAIFRSDLPAITDKRMHDIVEALASQPHQSGTVEQKVGAFYAAYLNTHAIDHAGIASVLPIIAEINSIKNRKDLARWQGKMLGQIDTPLQFWVMADFFDPTINVPITWQGGLGLPDRDYYLNDADSRFVRGRKAYKEYLSKLATLIGEKHPADVAQRVIDVEQGIAKAH